MQLRAWGRIYCDFSRADGPEPLRIGVIPRWTRMDYFAEAPVSGVLQEAMPNYLEAPSSKDDL